MSHRNYYFDLDGVLAIYERGAYAGPEPLYLVPGARYFRGVEPDMAAIRLVDLLWRESRETGDCLFTITSIAMHGAIFNEHLHDKMLWRQEFLPYLPLESFLVSVTSKRDVVEFLGGRRLTADDVLVDDYNKNLLDWEAAGGTSVKYCNGLNDPESFHGYRIYQDSGPDGMLGSIHRQLGYGE